MDENYLNLNKRSKNCPLVRGIIIDKADFLFMLP